MNRILPLVVFLVFAGFAAVMLLRKEHPAPAKHTMNRTLPDLSLYSFAGEKFALGDGIAVLNVFASWCTPCIAEHQELITLKKQFPHVMFHGIAWNDTEENITDMLKRHGNPYDHVWNDARGNAAIALGLRGVPESFIVKNGRIIYHLSGPITADIRTHEIEPLLAP